MAKRKGKPDFDLELKDLPPELRWREWMRRIEAVLFASASPVAHEDLARVVGQGVSIDLLIEDLEIDLSDRPYEITRVSTGWMMRTRPAYGPVIRMAADIADQEIDLSEADITVLAAIASYQPITRDQLREILAGRSHVM